VQKEYYKTKYLVGLQIRSRIKKLIMNFSIFSRKLVVDAPNEEDRYLDLLGKTIIIPRHPVKGDLLQEEYTVPSGYTQRPDLIAWDFYGNTDNIESILKLNGISNPYSIKAGMILMIPTENFIQMMQNTPKVYSEQKGAKLMRGTLTNINRQYQTPKNEKGQKRLEFLKMKYKKEVFLPPSLRDLQEADSKTRKTAKDRKTLRETLNVTQSIRIKP